MSMSIGAVKIMIMEPTAHLEKRMGTQEDAIKYCTKEETRIVAYAPITKGIPKAPGKRTDLADLAETILGGATIEKLMENDKTAAQLIKYTRGIQYLVSRVQKLNVPVWRALQVYLISGPTGIGKTRFVVQQFITYKHRWVYEHYPKDQIYKLFQMKPLWADHYEGEDILLIDDLKVTSLSVEDILHLLDGYPLQIPIKGGSVWANYTKVVVTADHDFTEAFYGRDQAQIQRRFSHRFICENAEDIAKIPLFE